MQLKLVIIEYQQNKKKKNLRKCSFDTSSFLYLFFIILEEDLFVFMSSTKFTKFGIGLAPENTYFKMQGNDQLYYLSSKLSRMNK